jgi:para-aminobenzoate synthetase
MFATIIQIAAGAEMKLLVIDNYDSFTYNLVHFLAEITHEVPLVVRNDEITWDELKEKEFDGVVLSPGPGRPDRLSDFGICRDAIEWATVPLLGVCLGHQGIAVSAGAAIIRAPAPMHGRTSLIRHNSREIFSGISSPFKGARYHSLVVQRPLPSSLEMIAWTDDGLVMALSHRYRPQWGVQFHPESIITDHGRKLLENFCEQCRRQLSSSRGPSKLANWPVRRGVPVCSTTRRAFWRELPREINAEAVFCSLFSGSPYAFWLDSSLVEPGRARWSYMGDASGPNAASLQYRCLDKRIEIHDRNGNRVQHVGIFDYLEQIEPGRMGTAPPCPFTGGYVGWFGYELRHDCGSPTKRISTTPDAMLIYSDRFIAVDHVEGKTYIVAIDDLTHALRAEQWLNATQASLERAACTPIPETPTLLNEPIKIFLDRDKSTYLSDVDRCLELIRQGETYQVCLTNELRCESKIEPLTLYRTMRKINPAPYAAFIKWPGGAVLSASPERFISIDGDGNVETKPIKGTIRRDPDPRQDCDLAEKLRTSEKDRAENVMIVDLLRNDLSRSCKPGSVSVQKLFDVESYRTVHQLVSTVQGILQPTRSAIGVVRGAFPGGSMTGAPKSRTLQFIDDLEQRARGIYSGCLGWLGNDGALDFSIVIRTIIATQGHLSIGVGGAIVAASTPEGEFEEMLLKAQASIESIVVAATGSFSADDYQLVGTDAGRDRPMTHTVHIPSTR